MNSFAGIPIIVTPDQVTYVPNMQLSRRVCEVLSPAMAEETNKWMLEFFGTHPEVTNITPDDMVYKTFDETYGREVLFMNPRTYEKYKRAVLEMAFKSGPFDNINYRW